MSKELKFNNGKFTIMSLGDLHEKLHIDTDQKRKKREDMHALVEAGIVKFNPDLVVLLGDTLTKRDETEDFSQYKAALRDILKPVIDHKIPFCFVLGNHEHDQGQEEQTVNAYMEIENCVGENDETAPRGNFNCNILVKNTKGNKNILNLWFIDSNNKYHDRAFSKYDWVSEDQIEWYERKALKIAEENGGNYSAVWITFVNKIAEDLAQDYPDVMIDTLAYKNTQSPPTKVKPRENVCVRLCSINCCFTHPINDPFCPKCKAFRKDIIGWGKICNNVHIWDYNTNFHYFISTFANFGVLRENMRFFAENNVVSVFPQGNNQGASGEFGELRAYLIAQLMWNPYMTEEEYYALMDEFLEAYYGEGWMYIREFIDLTTRLAANGGYNLNGNEQPTSATCGQGIYGHPLTAITRQEYLNYEYRFDECWALAEELAGDKVENVRRSMMQWRLTKLYLRPNAEEAAKLIADAKAAGVVWKEGQPNVLASSDLSLSPYYWKYGS